MREMRSTSVCWNIKSTWIQNNVFRREFFEVSKIIAGFSIVQKKKSGPGRREDNFCAS